MGRFQNPRLMATSNMPEVVRKGVWIRSLPDQLCKGWHSFDLGIQACLSTTCYRVWGRAPCPENRARINRRIQILALGIGVVELCVIFQYSQTAPQGC